MSRQLVPVAGLIIILSTALTLIFVVTLRPWADSNSGYDTHLNFRNGGPDGYSRSVLTWVDTETGTPLGWVLQNETPDVDLGYALFIARGCASCHGLEGVTGVVGGDLDEASKSKVRKSIRKGEGGMPVYHEEDLTDEQVALIVGYLMELRTVKPAPTPSTIPSQSTPSPTVQAIATPTTVPPPTLTPTPDVIATGTPSSDEESTPVASTTPTPEATPTSPPSEGGVFLSAAAATITVDGDTSDWASIPGTQVTLQQILPIPGVGRGELSPIDVTLKVATDSERIYVLMEVPDDYDYVPDDNGLSGAFSIMFRIDEPAAPHMGTTEENQRKSLGVVDIWFWKLDCGPGEISGGGGIQGGNDPACNLDDERAITPEDLEDDGTVNAENSLVGVWEHTARAQGQGAPGTWIIEISRPLQTGDPEDVQLSPGMKTYMALSYWDADETQDGWTGAGHLQSSTDGWIEVQLP